MRVRLAQDTHACIPACGLVSAALIIPYCCNNCKIGRRKTKSEQYFGFGIGLHTTYWCVAYICRGLTHWLRQQYCNCIGYSFSVEAGDEGEAQGPRRRRGTQGPGALAHFSVKGIWAALNWDLARLKTGINDKHIRPLQLLPPPPPLQNWLCGHWGDGLRQCQVHPLNLPFCKLCCSKFWQQ